MKKIAFISLGCDKNRVDLEKMMFKLQHGGYELCNDTNEANVVIINTCAFILPARKESINNILQICHLKCNGILEKIVVTGCLPQKNLEELQKSIPEVDTFVQLKDNDKILEIVNNLFNIQSHTACENFNFNNRVITCPSHYAYVKIADGCDNFCTYCTIPQIRGRYKSREIDDIISEINTLCENGCKEIILIAQDVTKYGKDLSDPCDIVLLLQQISALKNVEKIRLHYCYPELITNALLNEIDLNPKICKYLDIPLQHVSTKLLKKMNRRSTYDQIIELISKIKKCKHQISIRSTFIVGFPNESHKDVKMLIHFLKKFQLDNVGFFAYSREEGTPAYGFKHQIPNFIKMMRLKKVYSVQQCISQKLNSAKIGQTFDVVIDYYDENNKFFVGRDEFNSPNVDYCVIIKNSDLKIGKTYKIKYTKFNKFVFEGEINEHTK